MSKLVASRDNWSLNLLEVDDLARQQCHLDYLKQRQDASGPGG
jgi:hypothetical protein